MQRKSIEVEKREVLDVGKKMRLGYAAVLSAMLVITVFSGTAADTFAEQEIREGRHCIVVDAGHGGEDGGCISCTGIPESRYNLEIAVRLDALLSFLGYHTEMIRTEDISVYRTGKTLAEKKISDLRYRTEFVNKSDSPLLLSIHQNQFPEKQYTGAQIFYNGKEEARKLAEILQNSFKKTVNPNSRRTAKRASGVYLMDHVETPGILIECGFLSNPEEERKLRTAEHQNKIACVISSSVSRFLET